MTNITLGHLLVFNKILSGFSERWYRDHSKIKETLHPLRLCCTIFHKDAKNAGKHKKPFQIK